LGTELYNLTAKVSKEATLPQISAGLKTVLAERFSIALHTETERRRAYALTVAEGGPKLKEVDPAKVAAAKATSGSGGAEPPPAGPLRPGVMPAPGLIAAQLGIDGSRKVWGWHTIPQLVQLARSVLREPVVDQTGLKGTYEVNLTYGVDEHDPVQAGLRAAPENDPGFGQTPTGAPDPLPTLAEAMKSTLGLQLKPETLPIEILVVDRANKIPIEN
jgi:uncharacterized protein (TIGR03435 family)